MTNWNHIQIEKFPGTNRYAVLTKPGRGIIGYQTLAAVGLSPSTKTTSLSKTEATRLGQVLEDWRSKQEQNVARKRKPKSG